tara:strand:+ start:194 stop:367 length:174 start_codon:yes stop_codon:yes gene_type:complete
MNPLEVNQLKMPYSKNTEQNNISLKLKHPWIYFIVFILAIVFYYLFPKKSKIMKGGG